MSLQTSVESLDDNKVRLHVAVPAAEFERAIDAAFRKLAHEVKIDGFRPGKAPRRILEARLGTEVARDQALRDSLPEFYLEAVVAESIDVIAPPEIDITAGEEEGDVEFDAVVEVRPEVTVEGYDALQVEIPAPEITDEMVDAQVDQLRERFADIEDSTTPLIDGNYAEIDIKGFVDDEAVEGLTATDYLYEVGSGMLVPKLDEELRGKKAGDILKFTEELPERFGERAGEEVAFQVLVKDAKKKVLPEVTDEWAAEVSEFESADELRDDVRKRLDLYARIQAQMLMRDKVMEAAAGLVTIDIPVTLVNVGDGASPARRRAPARGAGDQDDDPAVPRRDRRRPEPVHRRAARARDARCARRPRVARGDRAGRDRRHRRRARRRGRAPCRAGRGEARQVAEGSRTAWCSRGGTL